MRFQRIKRQDRKTKYSTEKNVYADTVAGKSNSNWKSLPRCIINFCRVLGDGQRFRLIKDLMNLID